LQKHLSFHTNEKPTYYTTYPKEVLSKPGRGPGFESVSKKKIHTIFARRPGHQNFRIQRTFAGFILFAHKVWGF
jgi:hypothetical protein